MESAALTSAHDHARSAATATLSNSIATAGHQHDLAAAAFGDAAHDTHNAEALRILALLQDHHRKLAGLIKEAPRPEKPSAASAQTADSPSTPSTKPSTSRTTPANPPPSRRRLPQSSIASNLAEKRGIPSARRTTSSTSVNASGAVARNEQASTPVRDLLEQQSRKSDAAKSRDSLRQPKPTPQQPTSPPAEDNFRRFYSAFGGVISAISAPLAFTSLPLNPAPPTPVVPEKQEPKHKTRPRTHSPEASRTVKASVPDLAALISKPALRALRDDNAARLGPFANNESFYLVPGTATYASILQSQTGQPSHLKGIDDGSSSLKSSSHEEFVDARENVGPPSPTSSRRPHSRGKPTGTTAGPTPATPNAQVHGYGVTSQSTIPAGHGTGLKTLEELALENETLKALVDKQAKRIQMWETNSQNSFNALAQSFRARTLGSDPGALAGMLGQGGGVGGAAQRGVPSPPLQRQGASQPSSPAAAAATAKQDSLSQRSTDLTTPSSSAAAAAAAKISTLEARLAHQAMQLADLSKTNESLARQNEKNAVVIGRYREQWEKLKEGARRKELERRERGAKSGSERGGEKGSERGGERAKEGKEGDDVGELDGEGDGVEEPGFGKA